MKKLLVVDDDPDVRTLIPTFFRKNGFEVETASTKDEALDKVSQFMPHVILLDVLLSGADGREFCRQIKANEQTKDIPVLLFSAHPVAGEQITHYGADDFIPKPFQVQNLLERVRRHIEKVNQ